MLRGRQLVSKLLKDKELSERKVSLAIGKHGGYLYKYIHENNPAELKEKTRHALAEYLEIPVDHLREPGDPLAWGPPGQSQESVFDPDLMIAIVTLALDNLGKKRLPSDQIGKLCAALYGLALKRKAEGKKGKSALPSGADVSTLIDYSLGANRTKKPSR